MDSWFLVKPWYGTNENEAVHNQSCFTIQILQKKSKATIRLINGVILSGILLMLLPMLMVEQTRFLFTIRTNALCSQRSKSKPLAVRDYSS